MTVSIIVPVLNEAAIVREFLEHLRRAAPDVEIIVVDGGSKDGTIDLCRGVADHVIEHAQGRGRQMNTGARYAGGEILWFLHADSRITANALAAIETTLRDARFVGGCFGLQLVPSRWIYRVRNAIANRCVDLFGVALGDRGLFCRRETFFALDGYPDQPLLEDADFYRKLHRVGRVRRLPIKIQSSARRYETLGPIRTVFFYLFIMTLYVVGTPIQTLHKLVHRFFSRKSGRREADAFPELSCRPDRI
jgi:rSAM/selenodomain-associated transferase 2